MTQQYLLAQINIAKGLAPLDDPVMKGFVDQIEHINKLVESSEGFVWRLEGDGGDATDINAFDDELIVVNMSVWESLEALKNYVYSGDHLAVLKQKKTWFEKMEGPMLALWWIPAGTVPTVEDGKAALESLKVNGPTEAAFTFAKPYEVLVSL